MFCSAVLDIEVRRIHARYNAREFGALYDDADPAFRASVGRETFIGQVAQTSSEFGPVQNAVEKQ